MVKIILSGYIFLKISKFNIIYELKIDSKTEKEKNMNVTKITFTGREDMLTKGIQKASSAAQEYVKASKIYSPKEIKAVENAISESKFHDTTMRMLEEESNAARYSSPFAPTSNIREKELIQTRDNNYNWAVAHGTPVEEAKDASMHIDIFG